MNKSKLKWLIISQSSVFFASNLVFPFYILFIKNVGSGFTEFGLSYGIFALSAALVHPLLGRLSSRLHSRVFLTVNSWGMAGGLLLFPLIDSVYQVYAIQVVFGLFGAMQKHGEKTLLADYTDGTARGVHVGNYHFWTSIFAAIAIILGGIVADYFTIHLIFYLGSLIFFISGLLLIRSGSQNQNAVPTSFE